MTDGGLDGWIATDPIPSVVQRMKAIRSGVEGLGADPATAVRILQTFALRRPIDDLLELVPDQENGHFDRLDATAVLALAALIRPVEQAAQLAIGRWETERVRDPLQARLTDSIVHDVTAQRTVPEVAVFVRTCLQTEPKQDALVEKTLTAFVGVGSGRTNLDKALLNIALSDERCGNCEPCGRREKCERCGEAASMLLGFILEANAGTAVPVPRGGIERDGIVGTLRHLSPSQRIVEDWIDERMSRSREVRKTLRLVAELLVVEPAGARGLAEHIGGRWSARRVCDLCEILVARSDECFTMVRGFAAARPDPDVESLADLIKYWQESEQLSGTLKELLADIVARGSERSAGPRSLDFIEDLDETLVNEKAPEECRAKLRIAVAEHVYGRSGAEVAKLLGEVGRRADLRRAAKVVNERLTAQRFAGGIDGEAFVEYFKGLEKLKGSSSLTFWAVQELSDPKASDGTPEATAEAVADIAARLYTQGLDEVGFDLLERRLENEQAITPRDAADIVQRVRGEDEMPGDDRWRSLLGATVGRWAEIRRRDEVLVELADRGFHEDCEAVIHSVQ